MGYVDRQKHIWQCGMFHVASYGSKKIQLSPLMSFDLIRDLSSLSHGGRIGLRGSSLIEAVNITEDKQKQDLLLYQAIHAIFKMIPDTDADYTTSLTKLKKVFSPKKITNMNYEIFQFHQAVKQTGETIAQFITRLQKLAAHCDFTD